MNKKLLKIVPLLIVIVLGSYLYTALKQPEHSLYYGEVQSDSYDVYSEVAGLINGIFVKEGDVIQAGTSVVKIDDSQAILTLEKAQVAFQIAQENVTKATSPVRDEELTIQGNSIEQLKKQEETLRASRASLQASLTQSVHTVAALKESNDLSKESLDRIQTLYESGAASKVALDEAEVAYSSSQSSYESAKLQSSKLRSELNGVDAQIESIIVQIGSANEQLSAMNSGYGVTDQKITELSGTLATVDMKIAEDQLLAYDIQSQIAGRVESVNFNVGEYINPGSPVITVTDTESQTVKIYVYEKDLNKIEIGEEIVFTANADHAIQLNGHVKSIGKEAMFTPVNVVIAKDRDRLVFEVEVTLEASKDVRSGMLLFTDFDDLE